MEGRIPDIRRVWRTLWRSHCIRARRPRSLTLPSRTSVLSLPVARTDARSQEPRRGRLAAPSRPLPRREGVSVRYRLDQIQSRRLNRAIPVHSNSSHGPFSAQTQSTSPPSRSIPHLTPFLPAALKGRLSTAPPTCALPVPVPLGVVVSASALMSVRRPEPVEEVWMPRAATRRAEETCCARTERVGSGFVLLSSLAAYEGRRRGG